jgi:hypothetical protein
VGADGDWALLAERPGSGVALGVGSGAHLLVALLEAARDEAEAGFRVGGGG